MRANFETSQSRNVFFESHHHVIRYTFWLNQKKVSRFLWEPALNWSMELYVTIALQERKVGMKSVQQFQHDILVLETFLT